MWCLNCLVHINYHIDKYVSGMFKLLFKICFFFSIKMEKLKLYGKMILKLASRKCSGNRAEAKGNISQFYQQVCLYPCRESVNTFRRQCNCVVFERKPSLYQANKRGYGRHIFLVTSHNVYSSNLLFFTIKSVFHSHQEILPLQIAFIEF